MKASKALLVLGLFVQLACTQENVRKIRIDIPGYSPIRLDDYKEVVITNFRVEQETEGFDISREIGDEFAFDLGRRFKGTVSARSVPWDREGLAGEKDFWAAQGSVAVPALFLTGRVRYLKEVRKALTGAYLKEVDGPFRETQTGLAERTIYTLDLTLFLIRADTGEVLFTRDYKETQTYGKSNQPYPFAFYELFPRVKLRFLRMILGEEMGQERYLLLK
ncbi:MAG: hypothetical protein ACYDH0_13765 [Candidatus Aminicenantales bacterium]